MRTVAAVFIATVSLLLGACASAPPMASPDDLFRDALFAPPSAPVDPDSVLALSPQMRRYLADKQVRALRPVDRRRQLIDALYRGDLRLEYDAVLTRTASQAFDARSGNCLALVMMTAAFAKELGLSFEFQSVLGEEAWHRADNLYIGLGHVNLLLDDRRSPSDMTLASRAPMVVDFMPASDLKRQRTRPIDAKTIVAMYFNNRAVESMTQGGLIDAYWYAREAIRQDTQMEAAYVTLAVVYRLTRHPELAETALRRVIDRDPENLNALSNRVLVLRDLGRDAEADALKQRLALLDPNPPFSFFHAGMKALHEGRLDEARRLFAREVQRAPYHHEFEYWLAVTYMQMNDATRAGDHLRKAMEVSTTRRDRDLYAAKLDRLKALETRSSN